MPLKVGSCLSLRLSIWRDKGTDPWVVEVSYWTYPIHVSSLSPLSPDPIPFVSYSPDSIKGNAILEEIRSLIDEGAVDLASPSPGCYSHPFVVWKASTSISLC